MELQSQRLRMREFVDDDFDALFEMEKRIEIQRYEIVKIPTEEDIRKFIHNAQLNASVDPRTRYDFAITVKPEDRVRGRVRLSRNNSEIREWEIGWTVHYDDWGKGHAVEAAHEVLNMAFGHLNAHRVVAFCMADNRQSMRVMEKLGMQQEGILREVRWWNNSWVNERVFAILEREWKM